MCIGFLESQQKSALEGASGGTPAGVLPEGREFGLRRQFCERQYGAPDEVPPRNERDFFIDNLLVRIHLIAEMI